MAIRWYIVHAYSNFEKKVAESIRRAGRPARTGRQVRGSAGPDRACRRGPSRPQVQFRAQVLPRLRAREVRPDGSGLPPHQEHAEGHGLPRRDNKPMPISEAEADRIKGQVAEGVERPKSTISSRSAKPCASPTDRSPCSTARSRSRRGCPASRSRCRSSAARRRSSWNSARSKGLSEKAFSLDLVVQVPLSDIRARRSPADQFRVSGRRAGLARRRAGW